MAMKPVKSDNLTVLQEMYQKFWKGFNLLSACDKNFAHNFKVHKIASIRYYQDYAVGKPYHICIRISKEEVAVQAYFNNVTIYDDFFTHYRTRIESLIGKRLIWNRQTTKASITNILIAPFNISNENSWDDAYKVIMPNAIKMKDILNNF